MFAGSVVHLFFFNDPAPTEIYTLPLHDALPISMYTNETSRTVWLDTVPPQMMVNFPRGSPFYTGAHTYTIIISVWNEALEVLPQVQDIELTGREGMYQITANLTEGENIS